MMEWERPIMKVHAQILMEGESQQPKNVLNIGFGMGIIDSILQEDYKPLKHYIVEAHPDVYKRMLEQKWDTKPNVVILFGRWQELIPQLIQQGIRIDAVFYDTYGEHAMDMEDFHVLMVQLLSKPNGVYSFFNGLAPDNIFFHGVACQVVKLQLSQLGLDAEFLTCEIQQPIVSEEDWEGIRRPYWHGRESYYLPRCTWNPQYLATGRLASNPLIDVVKKQAHDEAQLQQEQQENAKRQRN